MGTGGGGGEERSYPAWVAFFLFFVLFEYSVFLSLQSRLS